MTQDTLFPLPAPTVADNCEWYTPPHIIEAARATLGGTIDLDPASCVEANKVVQAEKIYTREDNGLAREWSGNVWLNPPYGRGVMDHFVEKLRFHVLRGDVSSAIVLTNACTDAAWWHMLADGADAIYFPRGRLRFWGPMEHGNSPTQGQTVFLFTEDERVEGRFHSHFAKLDGLIKELTP